MSTSGSFMFEIKRSVKQFLQMRLIFNENLPKFNIENSVWNQFILNGTNVQTTGNFFSYYSPADALPR